MPAARDACRGPRALPLAGGPTPAPRFRPGRWRAAVLIALHGLFALHLAHWLRGGETLSPLEPSEAIELSARGVVNAGAVFFALALLSTALLGRWFCGWGCHLVALQDLSRAALLRLGVTPRPLRSRALALVPLLACAYMFVLPWALRAWQGDAGVREVALTTRAFWETFPGPAVAAVTFVVCGGLSVLLLGSKGFCAYACPYGAAFGLLDRLAPGRIKVSPACNACGQCTAVCSSNVRVHAEVRDWGAVVDPGCMKCLDCVAHCPTGALSYGWTRPALLRRPRATPAPRKPAFAWREEALLAALFLLAFLAWRGLYHVVPFLLALGLAGILAWTWLLALRALRRPPGLKLLRWHLRREGRFTPAGVAFLGACGVSLALTAHAAVVQLLAGRARAFHTASAELGRDWAGQLLEPLALDPAQRADLLRAVAREERLRGLSLLADAETDLRLAWYHLLLGDDAACERAVRAALVALPDSAPLRCDWAGFLLARGRPAEALRALEEAAALDHDGRAGARPRLAAAEYQLGLAALERGDRAAAEGHMERSVRARPGPQALTALAFLLDKRGERARAAALLEQARALEARPPR